jgi:hypothetical protein
VNEDDTLDISQRRFAVGVPTGSGKASQIECFETKRLRRPENLAADRRR